MENEICSDCDADLDPTDPRTCQRCNRTLCPKCSDNAPYGCRAKRTWRNGFEGFNNHLPDGVRTDME